MTSRIAIHGQGLRHAAVDLLREQRASIVLGDIAAEIAVVLDQ